LAEVLQDSDQSDFLTWATQHCWRHWRHLRHWRLRRRGQDWHHWCKRRRRQYWFARRRWFSRMCPRLRDVNSLTEAGVLSRASAKQIGWLRTLDWRYWIVNADWRYWIVNLDWFDGWTWFFIPGRQ